MKTHELKEALVAADPIDPKGLQGLDTKAMEAELFGDIDGVPPGPLSASNAKRSHRGRLVLTFAAAALASTVAVVLLLTGGDAGRTPRAYGAELVRFADSTPLLLLESSGWRVQDLNEYKGRAGTEGFMEFLIGNPIPEETARIIVGKTGAREVGSRLPAAVRQRKVELSWHAGSPELLRPVSHPIRLPVLGTTALVNTHAERSFVTTKTGKHVIEPGRPGDRQMAAVWREGGYVLELRAAVPDLTAFEERLGWLTKVDSQTWLDAMPAKVVKAADHDAVIREMLRGIPLPSTFAPSRIPDEGLTTDRSQVAGTVINTVSCLWFRQWGDARRTGSRAAAQEAEKAMATAPRWPIVRRIEREGGDPETLLKLVKSMPSGVWQFGPHRWRLLPKAEGLGCARLGLPLLPRKTKRQREHGVPPPPS